MFTPAFASAAVLGDDIVQGDILRLKDGAWQKDYIVLDPVYTNTWESGTFLLSRNLEEKIPFRYIDMNDPNTDFDTYVATANFWEGSTAQLWCTSYYRNLPTHIRDAVIGVRTQESESGSKWAGINNIDGRNSDKDKVFLLSYREYDRHKDVAHINPGDKWRLRASYDCEDVRMYSSVVLENGQMKDFGTDAYIAARPAFNISLPEDVCAIKVEDSGQAVWLLDMEAMQHTFKEPTYTWANNNSSCTAHVECSSCAEKIEETVATESETQGATTTYTATFTNTEYFTTQTKKINRTPVTTKTAIKSATAPAQKYTGKALKPAVTVKDANGKTVPASAYTVTYANNTYPGTATATVKAKADSKYTGTAKATFKITAAEQGVYWLVNKKTGENLYTTAIKEVNTLSKVKKTWTNKGLMWYAPTVGDPIYRLVNKKTGDHHFTKSANEVRVLTKVKKTWTADFNGKPIFYSGGPKKVWRQYSDARQKAGKPGTHKFTTYNAKLSGWKNEGALIEALRYGK